MAKGISGGWPMVLCGLKSFLETGKAPNIMSIKSCSASAQAKVPEPSGLASLRRRQPHRLAGKTGGVEIDRIAHLFAVEDGADIAFRIGLQGFLG